MCSSDLLRRALRGKLSAKHLVWALLRQAHRLRGGLHGFCQTLQTYIMFDVLASAWTTFMAAVDTVRRCSPSSCHTVAVKPQRMGLLLNHIGHRHAYSHSAMVDQFCRLDCDMG